MKELGKRWQAERERLARLQLGRTLRVPLVNPARRIYYAALLTAGIGAFFIVASLVWMDGSGTAPLVSIGGAALCAIAAYTAWVASRVASHPDFDLTLTRTRLKMPRAPYRNGDSIQISLRDVEDVSLASRGQGVFWALRLTDGTLERVPADLVPAEYKALELVTRIRVRALHCRGKKKSSAAALAAVEAQVLTDGPSLGAIVVSRPKAPPEVYAVVRDLEEWNEVSAEVPPDHKLYVPDDVAPPEQDEP